MRKKTTVWLMIAASLMLVGCILTDTGRYRADFEREMSL